MRGNPGLEFIVLDFGTKRPWGKDSMTASGGNFIESFLNR